MNKRGEHFSVALAAIFLSIAIVLIAFRSEDKSLTGFAAYEEAAFAVANSDLIAFDSVGSLSTFSPGNYYIDSDGIVYWFDDESRPAVAIISRLSESQKNRKIYIDNNGNVGYLLE